MQESLVHPEERQAEAVERMSAVELLKLSERERMEYMSNAWAEWLDTEGYDTVAIRVNIADALTEQGAQDLSESHVPIGAYRGRVDAMFWGITKRMSQEIVTLPMGNLEAERDMVNHVKSVTDAPHFREVDEEEMDDIITRKETFVLPFIPTAELHDELEGRTLPPADTYNNKAFMRYLVAQYAGKEYAMPGFSGRYTEDQDPDVYLDELAQLVQGEAQLSAEEQVWVKHAGTSSGMATMRVAAGEDVDSIKQQLQQRIFTVPGEQGESSWKPDDVVVEHHINFGEKDGVGDFCLRGNILPNGQFVVQTVGRLICKEGEFLGMVNGSTEPDRTNQLEVLGLKSEMFYEAVTALEKVTQKMYEEGYRGPLSVDFFADDENVWLRDFNARDGGASVAANVKSYSPEEHRLDIEMAMITDRKLTEEELDVFYERCAEEGVLLYATSFMQHAKVSGEEVHYPLKMNADVLTLGNNTEVDLASDEGVNAFVRWFSEELGAKLGVRLTSPV